jgi:tRNA (guanine-N7-)-methyltransferase
MTDVLPPRGPLPRTYVRRQGRMTTAQARALAAEPDAYVLDAETAGDLPAAFGRAAPLLVEIGFGMGHVLLANAAERPDWNLLGVEVYRPGIGAVLTRARAAGLTNLRLIEADAVVLLRDVIPPDSIDELQVLFPDPWPKTRHHKRRLIQPAFTQLATSRLRLGGVFRLATDWAPYAEVMLEVLDATPGLVNSHGPGQYAPAPTARIETRFERRGLGLGHAIRDLEYRRVG